jgi:hypothetical protein
MLISRHHYFFKLGHAMIIHWSLVTSFTAFLTFTLFFSTACAQEQVYLQQAANVASTAIVKQASEISRPAPVRQTAASTISRNTPPPPPSRSEDVRILEFQISDTNENNRIPRARITVQ